MSEAATSMTVPTVSAEDRKAALSNAVAADVRTGWHVQSQTDYQAVLIRPGTRVNHVLHLILTLVTLGFWAIVWIAVAVLHKRERRRVVEVDQSGRVTMQ